MKNIIFAVSAVTLLAACESTNSQWRNDCQRYHSISTREFKSCMARVEEGRQLDGTTADSVHINPVNVGIVGENDDTKERGGPNE